MQAEACTPAFAAHLCFALPAKTDSTPILATFVSAEPHLLMQTGQTSSRKLGVVNYNTATVASREVLPDVDMGRVPISRLHPLMKLSAALLCLFWFSAIASAQTAEVRFLDGRVVSGDVLAITSESLSLVADGNSQQVSLTDVLTVTWKGTTADASQKQEIRLADGSVIPCNTISRSAREVTAESDSLGMLSIASDAVSSIRLQPLTSTVSTQWNSFLKRDGDKDLLVVPKRDGSGLDFLSGIVSSIGESETGFLLDGDTIPVPNQRVFGVIFSGESTSKLDGAVTVSTDEGHKVFVRDLTLTQGTLSATTSWGQSITLAVSDLQSVDLSGGRIRYLSDLEPVSETFYGLDPEGGLLAGLIDSDVAQQLYGPARDQTIEGGSPLRLRGVVYAKGLCIHSRTELVYALDQQYSSFEALAGVDDEVAFNLDRQVLLIVSGDGNELFRHTFQTGEAPRPVSIPVQGIQTLTILVDYADNNSQCDWLDLADARLILAADSQR